jgi:hypothetical protein
MAATAAAVAGAHRVAATAAAVATMTTEPAEQTAAVATTVATATAMAAARGVTAMRAGAAPVAAMAEFNRFGTAAQGHHEDNTVHFSNLQITKEPTHAEL